MKPYKVVINHEWTSKCNARCAMCPQELIENPQLSTGDTFYTALDRINADDVFRAVVAGYGEPTTHPRFMEFVSAIGEHPVRFDMASNGQQLDEARLKHMDGKLGLFLISFSSIDPSVYTRVHRKLDHERVKENIRLAQKTLKNTPLGISLTPLVECIETLPQTIEWLKAQGVELLTMSPTLYNRAGSMTDHQQSTKRLRAIIEEYGLHSQELDFIPSFTDIAQQTLRNRFRCIPRNSDLFISASGEYLYCYNDISHRHVIGDISEMSIREALNAREKMTQRSSLCAECDMLDRYDLAESLQVAGKIAAKKLRSVAALNAA